MIKTNQHQSYEAPEMKAFEVKLRRCIAQSQVSTDALDPLNGNNWDE